jgi:predicted DCC family thiol-disulfide oxidoreductase YuxK
LTERVREIRTSGPIVFYDGECGLCDRFIKRLLQADRAHRLRYATLQGKTAKELIGEPDGSFENWSVKLLDDQGIHSRSSAALRAMAHAGGVWRVMRLFLIVPAPIRDGVYRWVAHNRYRWFGRNEACMVPTPALKERFLP